MNEKKADKRKDTIKNIAIAFLAIMLILTFFSNTIMNYSLPEVATQAVQQGSISPQIRGTGTVAADDPYNLTVSETRKIASVAVKVGDEVKKGAVIYSLEDQESTELTDAQDNLEKLQLAYEQALLSGDINDSVITKVRSGNTDSLDAYQKKLKEINDQYVSATKDDAVAQAKLDLIKYEQAYAQALISGGTGKSSSGTSSSAGTASSDLGYNAESAADITYELTKIKTNTTNTKATIDDLTSQISTMQSKLKDLDSLRSTRDSAADAITAAQKDLSDYLSAQKITDESTVTDTAIKSKINLYHDAIDSAQSAWNTAEAAYEAALSSNSDYNSQISDLKAQLETSKANLSTLNAETDALTDAQNKQTRDAAIFKNNYDKQEAIAEGTKAQTATALADITKKRENLIKGINVELSLSSQKKQIQEAQDKLDRLKAKAIGASIKSPVDGTISSLAYVAGESTAADQTAAVIQVAGKPMTVSFSVTNDQAKKVKVGDEAQPQNAWYYTQFKATLTAIKPDTTDPAGKKLLTFQIVSPEVTTGQSVSIAIGESSQDYDTTVPNSAIREDNNGKFILVIQSKASPLGNRYIAQRVDVKVQASDDTTTAISGSLEGDEYVITTSTAPVKAGQQVRLANTEMQ